MSIRMSTNYTDFTSVVVGGKPFLRVGTPIEFAALIKAGYVVNSNIRPVKGNPPSYTLNLLVPELGRYVAILRDESIDTDISLEEYVTYVNHHASYFQSKRTVTTLR